MTFIKCTGTETEATRLHALIPKRLGNTNRWQLNTIPPASVNDFESPHLTGY